MPNSKKKVFLDHLSPYFLPTDNETANVEEHPYDLSPLLRTISASPLADSKRRIFGEFHMIHRCSYHEENHLWEIQILHLREKILPGIADDNGGFELIQLADNEYPAESTTLVYDEETHRIYMQRNLYGTSLKAMESYLQLLSPEGIHVMLKPIISGSRIDSITANKLYRKMVLVADSDQISEDMPQRNLKHLLETFRHYQGNIIRVELGFGHKLHGRLNANEVTTLVREAYEFSGTHGLSVNKAEDEDTAFETINLLDDRETYKLDMEYSRQDPITHERLFLSCVEKCR